MGVLLLFVVSVDAPPVVIADVANQILRFNMADSNQGSGSNWTAFFNFLLFSSLKHYQIFKIEFVFFNTKGNSSSTVPQNVCVCVLAFACQIDQSIWWPEILPSYSLWNCWNIEKMFHSLETFRLAKPEPEC